MIDAIYNFTNQITIIIITHRLNTVKKCDNIFLLDKGEIKKQGKFIDVVGSENLNL